MLTHRNTKDWLEHRSKTKQAKVSANFRVHRNSGEKGCCGATMRGFETLVKFSDPTSDHQLHTQF